MGLRPVLGGELGLGDPTAPRACLPPCLLIACSPDCEKIIAAINFLSFSTEAAQGRQCGCSHCQPTLGRGHCGLSGAGSTVDGQ